VLKSAFPSAFDTHRCGTVGRQLAARSHKLLRFLATLAGFLLVLGVPGRLPAQSPGVGQLQQRQASLAAQSRAAVVELYGLESRLDQARADLAQVEARAAALARTQASVRRRYRAARQTAAIAQRHLDDELRFLYEQGEPDPIAVVLGATSLENAIDGLDAVHRAARATQSVLDQTRAARSRLVAIREELAVQVLRTSQTRSRLVATAAGLEQARAERTAYLAGLRREQALTATQISQLEQQAQEARRKAEQVTQQASAAAGAAAQQPESAGAGGAQQPAPPATSPAATADTPAAPSEPPPAPVESVSAPTPAAPVAPPPPPRPGGTMTVYATGYCLKGTTATGLPVGTGIVATDPSVIPLGTRMTIPGYGEGVAADTGGAVVGKRIDVWIRSCADADAFNRTVTITFR
jgi:3D (Asp-Asp-Asp) domain-containing protein/septal ring factor EnvC (AmiA/AmiB activator)